MQTKISSTFSDILKTHAESFAKIRSKKFSIKSRKLVERKSFETYFNIGLYLYIKIYKTTNNFTKFDFNHISSRTLKSLSTRLYREVTKDLENSNIIKINHHYSNFKKNIFTKSFLLHRNVIKKIKDNRYKFNETSIIVDVPDKILKKLNNTEINDLGAIFISQDDTPLYGSNNGKNVEYTSNFYNQLEFDKNSLNNYFSNDEFEYCRYLRILKKLKNDPKLIKNRWYHAFHEFSKDFRESVLRFEGQRLKEVFDVKGCDLHMLAKYLESENSIPIKELKRFQKDVKEDFRVKFGHKKNGKCYKRVKHAFKVYLNGKQSMYNLLRTGSFMWRIDKYFKDYFPNIRDFIIQHDDLWKITMKEEFNIISEKMFNILNKRGIKSFTCHDAVYIKENIEVPDIENIFYDSLDLLIDREEKFFSL